MLKRHRPGFGIQIRGKPIQDAALPKKFDSGIVQASTMGLVSEYEEREAAVYANYSPQEWRNLDYSERALTVAQYRCHFLIEAHMSAAAERAAERNRDKK
jgi:hypothetical protein